MTCPTHRALAGATLKILRRLARLLLHYGVAYGEFAEWGKRAFVEVASRDFGLDDRPQSISRVSVLTGLSRKEVARVERSVSPDDGEATLRYNRAVRVVSAWVREPEYCDRAGQPAPLPMAGTGASFSGLVRRFSGDVPPRAILDELCRVGMAEVDEETGTVRLLERSYVPRAGEAEKVEILGTDVGDLIATIGHNLAAGEPEPFFQRKVAYDNLPREAADRLLQEASRRAQALIEDLDHAFSRWDRDANPEVRGEGRTRLVTGVYVFEEDVPPSPPPTSPPGTEAADPAEQDQTQPHTTTPTGTGREGGERR